MAIAGEPCSAYTFLLSAFRIRLSMGLYDREYYRNEPRGMMLGSDWSAVTTLIVINVLVFLAELFTTQNHWIVRTSSLDALRA